MNTLELLDKKELLKKRAEEIISGAEKEVRKLCTVATDAMARYKRLQGYDVMFLTGTDEHGQKIEQKAEAAGVTPQQYVDNVVAGIKELWKLLNISNDRFIRTTDDYHEESVQKIFKALYDKGYI